MILQEIVKRKRHEVEESRKKRPLRELKSFVSAASMPRDFYDLSRQTDDIKIIAEVKKASPSKGVISRDFDPVRIASAYENAGAFAISVLTDEKYFMGSLDYLSEVKRSVSIPVLRKDFMVDQYQIYEARSYGADIILLIVSVLDAVTIREFRDLAQELGMSSIVEVHDESELEVALEAESRIIGINNRDLKTFDVDLNTSERLVRQIPDDVVVISESGISDADNISRLLEYGISTFLIGESFMRQDDPGKALKSLLRSVQSHRAQL